MPACGLMLVPLWLFKRREKHNTRQVSVMRALVGLGLYTTHNSKDKPRCWRHAPVAGRFIRSCIIPDMNPSDFVSVPVEDSGQHHGQKFWKRTEHTNGWHASEERACNSTARCESNKSIWYNQTYQQAFEHKRTLFDRQLARTYTHALQIQMGPVLLHML
jgi:hypothetical protein